MFQQWLLRLCALAELCSVWFWATTTTTTTTTIPSVGGYPFALIRRNVWNAAICSVRCSPHRERRQYSLKQYCQQRKSMGTAVAWKQQGFETSKIYDSSLWADSPKYRLRQFLVSWTVAAIAILFIPSLLLNFYRPSGRSLENEISCFGHSSIDWKWAYAGICCQCSKFCDQSWKREKRRETEKIKLSKLRIKSQ